MNDADKALVQRLYDKAFQWSGDPILEDAARLIERLAGELAEFEGSDAVRECVSLRAELDRSKANHIAAVGNAQEAYTDLEMQAKAHLMAGQGEIDALRSQLAARDAELKEIRDAVHASPDEPIAGVVFDVYRRYLDVLDERAARDAELKVAKPLLDAAIAWEAACRVRPIGEEAFRSAPDISSIAVAYALAKLTKKEAT